nr:MAG TPA: hypothetical protein [Caudoviricetes sp.]
MTTNNSVFILCENVQKAKTSYKPCKYFPIIKVILNHLI